MYPTRYTIRGGESLHQQLQAIKRRIRHERTGTISTTADAIRYALSEATRQSTDTQEPTGVQSDTNPCRATVSFGLPIGSER
jgi:hypothetical protein